MKKNLAAQTGYLKIPHTTGTQWQTFVYLAYRRQEIRINLILPSNEEQLNY
jgi:hypothetical protein